VSYKPEDQVVLNVDLRIAREQFRLAILTHMDQTNQMLNDAMARALTPEYVGEVVDRQARTVLEEVIREEIGTWLRYGAGRLEVRAAIQERLDLMFPENPA
jgi:hypothetical protein